MILTNTVHVFFSNVVSLEKRKKQKMYGQCALLQSQYKPKQWPFFVRTPFKTKQLYKLSYHSHTCEVHALIN